MIQMSKYHHSIFTISDSSCDTFTTTLHSVDQRSDKYLGHPFMIVRHCKPGPWLAVSRPGHTYTLCVYHTPGIPAAAAAAGFPSASIANTVGCLHDLVAQSLWLWLWVWRANRSVCFSLAIHTHSHTMLPQTERDARIYGISLSETQNFCPLPPLMEWTINLNVQTDNMPYVKSLSQPKAPSPKRQL